MLGTIVTWDLRGMDFPRSEELRSLLKTPTAYRHQLRWQRYLRSEGVLGTQDYLFYRCFEGRVVMYAMRLDMSQLEPRFNAEYLGTIEYPSMALLTAAKPEFASALQSLPVEFDALALTPAIVKRIEWHGGIAVRAAGGAYYLPPDAMDALEPVFNAIQREGGRVRIIDVTADSEIAREIARDGFRMLSSLLETLKRAVETAKSEARKQKSIERLRQVERQLRHYAELLKALADDVAQTDVVGVTADLLMEVAI